MIASSALAHVGVWCANHRSVCFICALVAGDPAYHHHVVYDDGATTAFLNRCPTLRGYCLVAPRRHVEDWALTSSGAHSVIGVSTSPPL